MLSIQIDLECGGTTKLSLKCDVDKGGQYRRTARAALALVEAVCSDGVKSKWNPERQVLFVLLTPHLFERGRMWEGFLREITYAY